MRPRVVFDRKMLLATVSAVALTFAWGPEARAADISVGQQTTFEPSRFDAAADIWVAVEGRYNMFTNSDIFGDAVTYDAPIIPPTANGDPDDGWSGGLELGARPAGSQWDYVGRLIYGKAEGEGSSSYYNGYDAGSAIEVEEEHIIADFEVGRHMNVGMGDTRIHAGVRFVHFDANASGDSYGNYVGGIGDTFYNEFEGDQTITAAGPRIGIDQKIPVANNLSVDLSAAGAVLFGVRDTSFGHSGAAYSGYSGPFPFGHVESDSQSVTVWNAEASAALTYLFGNASVSAGYRIDAFWDLYDGAASGDFASSSGDRITHGPFAKLKVYLSGGDH